MARKLQLQIPTPCHENWEKMTQTEKGRFCASCQKHVIDFSNKSDREIAMFFKKPTTGSVCGRFMDDQLNRNIEIPKKRIPWLKYFFQIAIPAFLTSCEHRTPGKEKAANEVVSPEKTKRTTVQETCTITTGVILPEINLEKDTDTVGLLLSEPTVGDVTGTTSQQKDPKVKSSVLPELKLPAIHNPVLTVSEIDPIAPNPTIRSESLEVTAGVVVLAIEEFSTTRQCSKIAAKAAPLLRKFFKDSASTKFTIYPNPVHSNSNLNIEWKQKDHGDYLLQLFNQLGQLILSEKVYIGGEVKLFTMNMPSIISGNYFLKLTSKTTGRSYTEKLIVN